MDTPQIQKSKDYSIFKFVNFNRDKQKKHIETVKKMLQRENLLAFHPIIVNKDMEVIDGQHRLAAAQELGLEIFYIQGEVSYEHILHSNLIQRKATLGDIIKFYAIKDHLEDYIKIREYSLSLNINPKALLGLIFGNCSPAIVDFIKTGKFKLPSDSAFIEKLVEAFMNFLSFVKEKKITPFSMFTNHTFTIGFRNLVLLDAFNESVFFSKLQMRWFDLKPQMNAKEWTKVLIDIYNWKNHNKLNYLDE